MKIDATDIVRSDVIFLALAGFVAISILLLPHINPPETGDGEITPPGNLMVEIRWPDAMNVDVDLWVQAPHDVPVGYSNLNGAVFNLLRDDLGNFADLSQLNYENAYSRGLIPGEYVVNVHLYRNRMNQYPVPVNVIVSKKPPNGRMKQIIATKTELDFVGQEVTAVRFELGDDLEVVAGSMHDTPKQLRTPRFFQ